MGLVQRMRENAPSAFSENWVGPKVADFFTGGMTGSGVRVGGESALKISTYFACTNVIGQDVGKLPLVLYRRLPKGGRERARDHYLYKLLRAEPNRHQTSYRFRSAAQNQISVRGNTFAFITRYRGKIRELLPIHPDKVQIKVDKYKLSYEVDGKPYDAREIFHVRGFSLDGYRGVSIATYARESLGLSMAMEGHGARLFGRGALFRGILTHPGRFKSEEVQKRVLRSWDSAYSGENSHGTALLEEGMKYERVSMSAEDSQFLGSREFQAYDVARWFRMPPHKVGLMAQSTNNNIEHQALEYVSDTLLPWLISWEQECNSSLLTEDEREEYYFEHLPDVLLRGDTKTRFDAYKTAILTGFMSRNEAREKENWNPADGLDEFLEPLNMDTSDNRNAETK